MADLANRYIHQLFALLPGGPAWPRDPGTVRHGQIASMADTLARADRRGDDILREALPHSSLEMLADWERVAGLPDPCSAGIITTLQERRDAVVARLTATGGQSRAYFAQIIAALGYTAEIREHRPFICGRSHVGDVLGGPHRVRHTWRVKVMGPRVTLFRAGASQAGDKLGKITRAEDLECILNRLKPAHTTLIVSYEGA